jgi:hypothetical protein
VPPAPVLPTQASPPTVQSVLVQHVVPLMHVFVAEQAFWPEGQLQLPPGPVQVSPATRQSAFVQHVVVGMH